ncbi:HNH endonuclease [Streptomyces sp. NPDC053513]|uniref:HNH endonuclease n=1 Tax=unclassified Streptomyces TaxID=2593676 RepID=UPI0037D6A56B
MPPEIETRPLPQPNTPELHGLVSDAETRAVYRVLYEAETTRLTMGEIRDRVSSLTGKSNLQLDRRLRSLRAYFLVPAVRDPHHPQRFTYALHGWQPDADQRTARKRIRASDRAFTLHTYGYRCAACGRTPKDDHVKLVIDHKVPLDLGGTNEVENLQPLCEEDNHAKQALFSDHEESAEALRVSLSLPEAHLRIGELLKAMEGIEVPKELIALVAREENHGDPTRRMRELRDLGWKIKNSKRKAGRRSLSFYRLDSWEPWPPGGPKAAIARMKHARKQARRLEAGALNASERET